MNFEKHIATVEGFPKAGISFKDITPLMQNGEVFHAACDKIVEFAKKVGATVIVGPESRGFIFGCPVAYELKIGFVPIRKPGKLPREVITEKYDLEYGSNTLCMHADALTKDDKVFHELGYYYIVEPKNINDVNLDDYVITENDKGKLVRFNPNPMPGSSIVWHFYSQ